MGAMKNPELSKLPHHRRRFVFWLARASGDSAIDRLEAETER